MDIKILDVNAPEFRKYGRVLSNLKTTELLSIMDSLEIPKEVIYKPCIKELEATSEAKALTDEIYGELPIQIGYCNGNNYLLNALEYHRSSEVNIAATDLVLLLGLEQDIEDDFTYDTAKVEAFLVKRGMSVELYATTLHYAPCNADDKGFKDIVVLPKGTNEALECTHEAGGEDKLLAAKNKWLIGHEEGGLSQGSFIGLKGINISIK